MDVSIHPTSTGQWAVLVNSLVVAVCDTHAEAIRVANSFR